MEMIHIRNWEKWQTYRRDRGQPPWIKVHRSIMRDMDWIRLTDAQRGQIVAIWLLAADHDGAIPACAKTVQKLCFMESEPDLKYFINQGFITGCHDDATVTPERRQADATVTPQNREEEKREEKNIAQKFAQFWDSYPIKKSKARAEKIFQKINPSQDMLEAMIRAIGEQQHERDSLKRNKQFVPEWKHPSTWLNGECWTDETQRHDPETGQDEAADLFRRAI